MKKYTAKDVAFDGLFSALSVLVLMMLYYMPFNKNLMGTVLLMFFACAYCKRKTFSCVVASFVITAISFLFMDPLVVVFFVLPSVIFGTLARHLVHKQKAVFYTISIVLFVALFFLENFLYTTFFLQEDFISYIARKGIDLSLFGVDQTTDAGMMWTMIGYFVFGGIISVCEAVLFGYFVEYYDNNLRPLVERK